MYFLLCFYPILLVPWLNCIIITIITIIIIIIIIIIKKGNGIAFYSSPKLLVLSAAPKWPNEFGSTLSSHSYPEWIDQNTQSSSTGKLTCFTFASHSSTVGQ